MFLIKGRPAYFLVSGAMVLILGTFTAVDFQSAGRAAPFRGPPLDQVRTYRFTARIKANAGVSPFKVGNVIIGRFTYDLKGQNTRPDVLFHGAYQSGRHAITFEMGDLRFTGRGDILVTISTFDYAEHFGIVAHDLHLPAGWKMDAKGSQSFGFLLQNAPSKKVLSRPAQIPDRLSLPDFVNTRELRLDFAHGVRFPGGQVNVRATVFAIVESLEEAGN
jgi:hypothetical protein